MRRAVVARVARLVVGVAEPEACERQVAVHGVAGAQEGDAAPEEALPPARRRQGHNAAAAVRRASAGPRC